MGVEGISLVELLVAVAILSTISVATIQLIGTTDKELLQSQGERKSQQTDEAITSFIYDDFQAGKLVQSANPTAYENTTMPEDLQRGPGLTVVSMLGNDSRYNGVVPKCRLLADTSTSSPTFQFASDCAQRGNKSIGVLMIEMIAIGARITLAIEGAARLAGPAAQRKISFQQAAAFSTPSAMIQIQLWAILPWSMALRQAPQRPT